VDGSAKEECKMERRIGLHHPQMLPQKMLGSIPSKCPFLVRQFRSRVCIVDIQPPVPRSPISERTRLMSTTWTSPRPFGPRQYSIVSFKLVHSDLGHVFGHTSVTCLCANLGFASFPTKDCTGALIQLFHINQCATFSSHRVAG